MIISTTQLINIQAKYLKVFDEFLNNELAVGNSKKSYDLLSKQSRLDPGSTAVEGVNKSDDLDNGKDFKNLMPINTLPINKTSYPISLCISTNFSKITIPQHTISVTFGYCFKRYDEHFRIEFLE